MQIWDRLREIADQVERERKMTVSMPLPYESQWSQEWADHWLEWFADRLDAGTNVPEFKGSAMPTLLAVIAQALQNHMLELEVDIPGYKKAVIDVSGDSCEGHELKIYCCELDSPTAGIDDRSPVIIIRAQDAV